MPFYEKPEAEGFGKVCKAGTSRGQLSNSGGLPVVRGMASLPPRALLPSLSPTSLPLGATREFLEGIFMSHFGYSGPVLPWVLYGLYLLYLIMKCCFY